VIATRSAEIAPRMIGAKDGVDRHGGASAASIGAAPCLSWAAALP
jgi:hypothetical protein